jgi:L-alanine-DL-glutamate epimerase-like enolase superfamily enzyme
MIIKDVRITLLRMPWIDPPRWSLQPKDRELLLVEVETASGIVGLGYLMPLNGGLQTIATCLRELFIPRLIGKDSTQIEAIWRDLWRSTLEIGRMGITILALSAVDIALWDALGKQAGLPLYRLWGGFKTECPAYGSGCWRGLGGDGMIEKAKSYVNMGFDAIKMQCGHLYNDLTDVDHVKRMRDALGPDIDIMIDVNMAWTADQAISVGRKIEAYDIYWLEEPVLPNDFKGYFRVADKLCIRVVGGENHFTRFDLRPFLENPKIPILQPDVMRGGLTEIRKIATLADTWGMTVAPHLFHELMVHVVASIPNGHSLEYVNFLDDIWVDAVLQKNGIITVPERPGHGLSIKEEIVKDFAVKC